MPALVASRPGSRRGIPAPVRYAAARLVPAAIALYAVLAATGLVLTRLPQAGGTIASDRRVSSWFAGHRTPTLNTLTQIGSMLSDTWTAVGATALIVVLLRITLHRWREALTILTSILGELWIFLGVTSTVHRDRPAVPHLDHAPPTSSFPSGHTGAAMALYVGLAVVLVVLVRRGDIAATAGRVAVAVGSVLLCAIPFVVGLSRLYRGMHYLSDVLAGAVAGGLWMVVVTATLMRLGNAGKA